MQQASAYGEAALTHYLNNHKNESSQFYKKEAVHHIKRDLEYKFPDEEFSSEVTEEALQYMLFDFQNDVPFPEPKNPKRYFLKTSKG